jgi:hypothetical protein
MLTAVRALMYAVLLLSLPVDHVSGTSAVPDTTGLQFLGFRAGARVDELSARLQSLGGDPLRCWRSKTDSRVMECRAILKDPELGGRIELRVSAIDSVAGVMTLSGLAAPGQIDQWRSTLQTRYGRVGTRIQGTQSMLQWVRRGRMLRLTWRVEADGKIASVSLVDGHVLDDWGRARNRASLASPS